MYSRYTWCLEEYLILVLIAVVGKPLFGFMYNKLVSFHHGEHALRYVDERAQHRG